MGVTRYRYRFMRVRADGKGNETTSRKTFEKWLNEAFECDEFYVARLEWVKCEKDGDVPFGKGTIPHVTKTGDADAKEN